MVLSNPIEIINYFSGLKKPKQNSPNNLIKIKHLVLNLKV